MPTIRIKKEIYSALKKRAQEKGFVKTKDYIADVLEQVVAKIKRRKERKEEKKEKEEEEIKKKLRGLGYF